MKKLNADQCYQFANFGKLPFMTTEDLPPAMSPVVAQENAEKTIDFGLMMEKAGYNIFISGENSTRRFTYLTEKLNQLAAGKPTPPDYLYVHNFKNPTSPQLISLPTGLGKQFKDSMEAFTSGFKKTFESQMESKETALRLFDLNIAHADNVEALFEDAEQSLAEHEICIQEGDQGMYSVGFLKPLTEEEEAKIESDEDRFYTDEELENLRLNNKDFPFDERLRLGMEALQHILEQRRLLDAELDLAKENVEKEIATAVLKELVLDLHVFEENHPYISTYFENVSAFILENLERFKTSAAPQGGMLLFGGPPEEDGLMELQVNLLVDNAETKGAPIVVIDELDPHNLFGQIHLQVFGNSVETDFTRISAGKLMEANGGYLILNVNDLLHHPQVFDRLMTTLKNQQIILKTNQYREVILNDHLSPEAFPLDVKVILSGTQDIYHLLMQYEPRMAENFKVHAVFRSQMNRDESESVVAYLQILSDYIKNNNYRVFDKSALEFLYEYSSMVAGSQKKVSLSYDPIYSLIDAAEGWAEKKEVDCIDYEFLKFVQKEEHERNSDIKNSVIEHFQDELVLLQTEGSEVGVINGLAVVGYGDISFGIPSKVTANTYSTQAGIVSVDKIAKMTGQLYEKSVGVVEGFLRHHFGSDRHPLSMGASVTFEQNYGGIDGDSATSTMAFAIASDFADVPIKQSIAVTGSMNQKGQVQAIGGVNEKIEGFFALCKERGLTGDQGVIIPKSNIQHLMLNEEVLEAIREEQFSIYPIETFDEGMEILTGVPMQQIKANVYARIKRLHQNRSLTS